MLVFWFETRDYSYVSKSFIGPWEEDLEKRKVSKTSKGTAAISIRCFIMKTAFSFIELTSALT